MKTWASSAKQRTLLSGGGRNGRCVAKMRTFALKFMCRRQKAYFLLELRCGGGLSQIMRQLAAAYIFEETFG